MHESWKWIKTAFGVVLSRLRTDNSTGNVLGLAVVNYIGDWDPPYDVVIGQPNSENKMVPIDVNSPDMRLIAAAPELLEMVKRMVAIADYPGELKVLAKEAKKLVRRIEK